MMIHARAGMVALSGACVFLFACGCGNRFYTDRDAEEAYDQGYAVGFAEGRSKPYPLKGETSVEAQGGELDPENKADEEALAEAQEKIVSKVKVVFPSAQDSPSSALPPVTQEDLRTNALIDGNGNIVVVNVQPGSKTTEERLVQGSAHTVETLYPQGVSFGCYGTEPFAFRTYQPDSYLNDLASPRFLKLFLTMENAEELAVLGDDESALESALSRSKVNLTISRLSDSSDDTLLVAPVKSYEIADPYPVDIKKIGNASYAFSIALLPMFLEKSVYGPGQYAITDVFLTYRAGQDKERRVSGSCPLYHFEVLAAQTVAAAPASSDSSAGQSAVTTEP